MIIIIYEKNNIKNKFDFLYVKLIIKLYII